MSDELPYLPATQAVGGSHTQSVALSKNVEPFRHVRKSASVLFCCSLHPFGFVTPVHSDPSSWHPAMASLTDAYFDCDIEPQDESSLIHVEDPLHVVAVIEACRGACCWGGGAAAFGGGGGAGLHGSFAIPAFDLTTFAQVTGQMTRTCLKSALSSVHVDGVASAPQVFKVKPVSLASVEHAVAQTLHVAGHIFWKKVPIDSSSHSILAHVKKLPSLFFVPALAWSAGQLTQLEIRVRPGCTVALPAGQDLHAMRPLRSSYLPDWQSLQPAVWPSLNVPAAHPTQSDFALVPLDVVNRPAGHEMHLALESALGENEPTGHFTQPDTPLSRPAMHRLHSAGLRLPVAAVVLPAGQALQLLALALAAYFPIAQSVHFVAAFPDA